MVHVGEFCHTCRLSTTSTVALRWFIGKKFENKKMLFRFRLYLFPNLPAGDFSSLLYLITTIVHITLMYSITFTQNLPV